ncbi:MBL fold metallo-hydrolase [Alicyclobacillus dauci]|uniref:MBL fold metallo-hydrolase n=1 Tax=Alicyclobacillus dauci TaxID=1475485 RepID=A0ABY6ZAI5_9BACL|nr:MBL fold metallo-hydrolase [Alicyclobacillus dauci]WAH39110.1 MBL fold metallo-hydrolase [Alicyclobacillus dauci]
MSTPFPEGSVNAYLLLGNPVTLIDTGIWQEESVRQLQQDLLRVGITWQDIEQVVVTHMHMDHAGGVTAIQREVDVPVFVHRGARCTLEGGLLEFQRTESYFQQFFLECGAEGKVTRNHKYREEKWKGVHYVDDGDTIRAGGREYTVVYAPGHSQTDICLWHRESGDAFVGDHLLKEISANAFMEPPSPQENDRPKALLQYRASMLRTQQLPWKTIYPGHGRPYVGHEALIEQRFVEHEERCLAILQHLQDGKQTVYEISTTMFPWLQGGAVFLGLSEILGHLDLLVEQSRATVATENGVLVFRSA